MKTIYELDIHESIDIFGVAEITRVPGGWIYRMYKTSTFVPFSKEGDKKGPYRPPPPPPPNKVYKTTFFGIKETKESMQARKDWYTAMDTWHNLMQLQEPK